MRIQAKLAIVCSSALAAAALLGCTAQSVSSAGRAQQTAPAYIAISIPTQKALRRAAYLRSSMQSLSVAVAGGPPAFFTVGAGRPGCVAGDEATSCELAVNAPVGENVAFTVTTYASPVGGGAALATTTVAIPVTPGGANALALSVEQRQ